MGYIFQNHLITPSTSVFLFFTWLPVETEYAPLAHPSLKRLGTTPASKNTDGVSPSGLHDVVLHAISPYMLNSMKY